ncbi:MAG: alpha/beta hydrolase [Chloroflexi bacterium]|nr:MAG: alpha/beta hydrolase [Chloroflexota bacterium]
MDHLSVMPLPPYESALVDTVIGEHLSQVRPLSIVGQISPRAVLFIHSADDTNTTTPLAGERQRYQEANAPKQEWIASNGGHTGSLQAHTAEYEQRVLQFFATYLDRH